MKAAEPKSRKASIASDRLNALYDQDETAWLEVMSALAADGRVAEMDFANLSEYLADMARRDRREVKSRLVTLFIHLLKWEHQPDHRSGSWMATILEQQRELREILESDTLRNHALAVLADAYTGANEQATAETGMPPSTFPAECPWDLDALLTSDKKIGDANH